MYCICVISKGLYKKLLCCLNMKLVSVVYMFYEFDCFNFIGFGKLFFIVKLFKKLNCD